MYIPSEWDINTSLKTCIDYSPENNSDPRPAASVRNLTSKCPAYVLHIVRGTECYSIFSKASTENPTTLSNVNVRSTRSGLMYGWDKMSNFSVACDFKSQFWITILIPLNSHTLIHSVSFVNFIHCCDVHFFTRAYLPLTRLRLLF